MSSGRHAPGPKFIYFMRRADGVGAIKIGCSAVPEHRLAVQQNWSPEPLAIVARVPGGFADEKRLHRDLSDARLHGEWFEAKPKVLALLARVCATGELPPVSANDRWMQIERLYRSGKTLREIGEELGVTRERVRQLLRKAGVPSLGQRPEHMRRAISLATEQQIVAMGRRGCTKSEIATTLGVSLANVRGYLYRHGVKTTREPRLHKAETIAKAHEVAKDYLSGLKTAEIAEKHSIPPPYIYRLIRVAGVKPTRGAGSHALLTLPVDEIVAAYRNGATLKDLARVYTVDAKTLRTRISKAGALRSREESLAIRQERVRQANLKRHRVP